MPEGRSVVLGADPPRHPGPLYRSLVLTFVTFGGHALGIARGALDAFAELAAAKTPFGSAAVLREHPTVQAQVARAEALVESARALLYGAAGELWETVLAGAEPSVRQRARLQLAITHAVDSGVQAVDMMYDAAGGSAIYAASPLERRFRDIHTAAAHVVVSPRMYQSTGRVLLGLEPGMPFF